jgi:hypothetical protein
MSAHKTDECTGRWWFLSRPGGGQNAQCDKCHASHPANTLEAMRPFIERELPRSSARMRGEGVVTIRDASGAIVATDRCGCGRHKEAAKEKCCGACGTGSHGIGCVLRQEQFADTRRGVGVHPRYRLPSRVRIIRVIKPSENQ